MIHLLQKLLHLQFGWLFICCYSSFFFCFSFLFLISSQPRFSSVNVVLIFNVSLIAEAPSSPILLPVHFLLLFIFLLLFHFLFLISSLHRFSSVNVVLIFNDSLIAQAPFAPISLSVHYFIIHFLFYLLFLFFITPQIQFS